MNRLRKRKFAVESLESRTVLAGNVTAVLQKGNLIVTGDAANNGITITQLENGSFEVAGDGTTAINGQSLGTPAVFTGVTKNVKVDMKAGNDNVSLSDVIIPQNLVVDGGKGNDTIALTDVDVRYNAVLQGGAGNDSITATGVETRATLLVNGGNGSNTINVSESEGVVLLVNARKGKDTVSKQANDFKVSLQPAFQLKAKVADQLFATWERTYARIS
jgi:Ca2+-binding RTX toxin-like protein